MPHMLDISTACHRYQPSLPVIHIYIYILDMEAWLNITWEMAVLEKATDAGGLLLAACHIGQAGATPLGTPRAGPRLGQPPPQPAWRHGCFGPVCPKRPVPALLSCLPLLHQFLQIHASDEPCCCIEAMQKEHSTWYTNVTIRRSVVRCLPLHASQSLHCQA